MNESHRAVCSFDPDEGASRRRGAPRAYAHARKTTVSQYGPDGESESSKRYKRVQPRVKPFDRIVKLCSVRDRSQQELRERLEREGYEPEGAQEALKRAVDCGLVDDVRFADVLVRTRVAAGKGAHAIKRDLARHGIDAESLEGWPERYGLDDTSQVDRAVSFLRAHPPTAKDVYPAAFRKLVARGYSQAVATRATRIWYESQ